VSIPGTALRVEDLAGGICDCTIAREADLFDDETGGTYAYCRVCKRQVIPNDQETIYNSHFDHHDGWVFIVRNK
jgi:hypothetical protein